MNSKLTSKTLMLIMFFWVPILSFTQTQKEMIQEIQSLMLDQYIFLDKAKEVNTHLDQLMSQKYFDQFDTDEALAQALTEQMRKITTDNHLSVRPPRLPQERPQVQPDYKRRLDRYNSTMINGFQYFENNVGYFDMRFFGGGRFYPDFDAIMNQMSNADAIIIDVRYSNGGSPFMVRYMCSYFFDQHLLLSSIYSRFNDYTQEYWTVDVEGKKRPKVPVFILTSARTFSAAEDFPYTMQSHKRAKIIGEVTRGGAHPTRSHYLKNNFRVYIPFAMSINPITKTNWEGVGITPDVKVSADQALETAKKLASEAATEYKNSFFQPLETALEKSNIDEQQIYSLLEEMLKTGMIRERDINSMGYHYLRSQKNNAAMVLFKTNTLLHPLSANAFDSYAEGLAELGETNRAFFNYERAGDLAEMQKLENAAAFQRNFDRFKQKMEAGLDKHLVAVLDTIYHDDQDPIRKARELRNQYGLDSKEANAQDKIIHEYHAINLPKVKKIIAEHGWLGPDVIGEQGNSALFLVIQHSDLETQREYLPIMKKAAKEGKVRARNLAYLEDRVASKLGKKQIYGSQIKFNPESKSTYVWPIEDPANVDKRRATVGLGPLAPHIKRRFNLEWDLEEHLKIVAKFEAEQKEKSTETNRN